MKKAHKAIGAAMIGNALEYYDVMLYGFFATMLAPLFFPSENHMVSIISSLGTFAAGFLMRPIGGIVFGHIGDKFGRQKTLALTIFMVTIPTLTIGLLPTYSEIGIIAPITLVTCRLLQGLCVGGEYSGASIFVVEYSKKGREAFAGSILCAAGFFGAVLGTIIGFVCTWPSMPEGAWRFPFLLGTLIGLIGFYIRTQVSESPDFVRHEGQHVEKFPLLSIITKRRGNFLCTVGVGATSLIPFYLASVSMGYLLTSKLEIPTSQVMLINIFLNIFLIGLLPLMGQLADRVGKEKQMLITSIASVLIAYPLFSILSNELCVFNVICVQAVLGLITASFGAPSMAFLSTLYPVHERYSGIGFGYALGGALLGGTTPLIIATLSQWMDASNVSAYYLMLSGILGSMCVLSGKNTTAHHSFMSTLKEELYLMKSRIKLIRS